MLKDLIDKFHLTDSVYFHFVFIIIIIIINIIFTNTAITYLFLVSCSIGSRFLLRGVLVLTWWSIPSVSWIILRGYYNSWHRKLIEKSIHILFYHDGIIKFTQQKGNCWKNLNLFWFHFFLFYIRKQL